MVKSLHNYLIAAWAELGKVTWPTRRQAWRLTLMVIAFSAVFAVLLGLLDLIFSNLLQKLITKG